MSSTTSISLASTKSHEGDRIDRFGFLGHYIGSIAVQIMCVCLGAASGSQELQLMLALFTGVICIIWRLNILTMRLRDSGVSGWWAALSFVPFINLLVLLYAVFAPSSLASEEETAVPTSQPAFAS